MQPLSSRPTSLGVDLPGQSKKLAFRAGFLQPQYLWQLHAYILTGKGAHTLLSNLPVDCPVDNFVAKLIFDGKLKVASSS